MEWNEYIEDKIDNYLLNKLSPEERLQFEKEIASDPDLKLEVDAQKLLMGAAINFRKVELKDYIKKNTSEDRRKDAGPIWMSIAAAVILAVGAGFFVYLKNQRAETADMTSTVKTAPQNPKTDNNAPLNKDTAKPEIQKQNAKDLATNEDKSKKLPDAKSSNHIGGSNKGPDLKIPVPVEKPQTAETKKIAKEESKNSYSPILVSPDKQTENYSTNSSPSYGSGTITLSPQQYKASEDKLFYNKRKNNRTKNDDSVKGDILLMDSTINLSEAPANTKKDADLSDIKVSFWKSAVNFKGYHFYKRQLSLYGVSQKSKIQLISLDGNTYFKIKNKVYLLNEGDYYYPLSTQVKDKKILKELGF